jgi:hypothetical protein
VKDVRDRHEHFVTVFLDLAHDAALPSLTVSAKVSSAANIWLYFVRT